MAKIGGILQEVSGEELARQTGLEAPPTSPLGMQGLGASQDVAKMAGTGEQVRAVLRETLKERTDTRDVMGEAERGGARKRYDVQTIQSTLSSLGGLGSLDNRVADKARAIITGEGAVPDFTNQLDLKNLEEQIKVNNPLITPEALEAAKTNAQTALLALRDNKNTNTVVAVLNSLGIKATINDTASELATKLAATGVFKQATERDIKNAMNATAETTAGIKIKDLTEVDFDKQAVATILFGGESDKEKVDALAKLEKMTLGEVKAQLAAYRSETFTDLDELREAVANPFSSQSQKDFARKRLAELGAIGITSVEQKANDIQAQMEQGDTVKVGNKQVQVEEIMTDSTLRLTVATALSSPEELDKLRKTDKELADWVEKNQQALQSVKNQLTAGLGAFAAKQKEIKDYLADAPVDTLDKFIPGWRNASDVDVAAWKESVASTQPALSHVLNMTDKGKQGIAFSVLSALTPDVAKTFSTTILDSITKTATSEEDAKSLLKDYQSTEDKLWKGSVNSSVDMAGVPFFRDEEKTAYRKTSEAEALKKYAPEYTSLTALVNQINTLSDSNKVADRSKALRLAETLANIKGELGKKFSKEGIEEYRKTKQMEIDKKAWTSANESTTSAVDSVERSLVDSDKTWLKQRGSEVFSGIKADLTTIQRELTDGTISQTQATAKVEGLKQRMAGNLAAFVFDENHYTKDTNGALDSVELILNNNLLPSLSAKDKQGLLGRLESHRNNLAPPNVITSAYGQGILDRLNQIIPRLRVV
jgi:uncharacterized protein YheU (UPF0270 family)